MSFEFGAKFISLHFNKFRFGHMIGHDFQLYLTQFKPICLKFLVFLATLVIEPFKDQIEDLGHQNLNFERNYQGRDCP